MTKPCRSIQHQGVIPIGILIIITLTGVNGDTNITSCSVRVGDSRESLTLNVTYIGDPHVRTLITFLNPLRTITHIQSPCQTSSTSTHLIFTSCTNNSNTDSYNLYLNYDITSVTNTTITLREFNFPIQSELYTGDILVWAFNSSGFKGLINYCSEFSSLVLLGNTQIYIYRANYAEYLSI